MPYISAINKQQKEIIIMTMTIEQLKAKVAEDTAAAMARIAERKERLTLERQLREASDESLQEANAERELLNESAMTLNGFMQVAETKVKDAQLQTRTGAELKLNFFPTKRKHVVTDKLTGLMNSMVYTRADVSQMVAEELGLTEIDVDSYRTAMGRGDSFDPESGVIKGFAGNAVSYNSNLSMLASKMGIYIPTPTFTQEEFDTFYEKSVHKAELEQRQAQLAEEEWDQNNGHGLVVDMS